MYEQWAHKRQMRFHKLGGDLQGLVSSGILMAISGLGAHAILHRESGLHIFEIPDADTSFVRHSARVRVAPQSAKPRPSAQAETDYARACLSVAQFGANNIVRRYREQPSPLVRDGVTGWRTGKLEQVLGGDFDLMS
jgi:ATP-dependent Clp protease ATP-binding subunit ClpC